MLQLARTDLEIYFISAVFEGLAAHPGEDPEASDVSRNSDGKRHSLPDGLSHPLEGDGSAVGAGVWPGHRQLSHQSPVRRFIAACWFGRPRRVNFCRRSVSN